MISGFVHDFEFLTLEVYCLEDPSDQCLWYSAARNQSIKIDISSVLRISLTEIWLWVLSFGRRIWRLPSTLIFQNGLSAGLRRDGAVGAHISCSPPIWKLFAFLFKKSVSIRGMIVGIQAAIITAFDSALKNVSNNVCRDPIEVITLSRLQARRCCLDI